MVICDDVDRYTTKAHQAQTQKMVELYGDVILPPELTTIINRDLQNLEHVAPAGSDHLAIRKQTFDILVRKLLLVEEKPVQTRFVFCLLLVALPCSGWLWWVYLHQFSSKDH
jgi:hypothetical protein